MKQIIIYIILFLCATSLVIVIKMNEEPKDKKAMTISQYYCAMNPYEGIDVPLYLTDQKHLLTLIDAYENIYLMNEDASKKLSVTLDTISIDGEEVYLSETYTKYMLELKLPNIMDDFTIETCYIDILLHNNDHYQFEIGKFSYLKVTDDVKYLFWTSLEAIKDVDVSITRMAQIKISYDTLDMAIENISLGHDLHISYLVDANQIVIDIMYEHLLLYGCPIAIYYMDGKTQMIGYFNYIRSTQMLSTSGVLNHIYDVSNA